MDTRVNTPMGQVALSVAMFVLSTAAILARLHARRIRGGMLGWDDGCIYIAWICTILQIVGIWIGVAVGHVGAHSVINPRTGYPILDSYWKHFLQVSFANSLTSVLAVGMTKISVVLLYRRVFQGAARSTLFRFATLSLLGLSIVWTVSFFLVTLFGCWPISSNWQDLGADPSQCFNTNKMLLAQAWSDLFLDVLIISIPVPCILSVPLPMSKKRRIGLCVMFMLGALTVAFSTIRLVYSYQVDKMLWTLWTIDLTYILTPQIYWPMAESAIGVVAGCLPCLKPIFDNHLRWSRVVGFFPTVKSANETQMTHNEDSGTRLETGVVSQITAEEKVIVIDTVAELNRSSS